MANQLKKPDQPVWQPDWRQHGSTMYGTSWIIILLLPTQPILYPPFFASGNAQIAALYAVFLGVGLH